MRKIIYSLFLVFSLSLTACSVPETSEIEYTEDSGVLVMTETNDLDTIYTKAYQDDVYDTLQTLRKEKTYTLAEPFLASNPYGTNTTGLYIAFTTDEKSTVQYTVEADGYPDFTRTLAGEPSKEHEYLLVGIIPDVENKITITCLDDEGNEIDSNVITYHAPKLLGSKDNVKLELNRLQDESKLTDGLYAMLGNRTEEDNKEVDFILLYDNDGILRSEIPVKSYRACNMNYDGEWIYFSISSSQIAAMDARGRIHKFYNMQDYHLHHDYILGQNNDLLVLASKEEADTEEDMILSVDLDSKEVDPIIDLKELFHDYYQKCSTDSEDPMDWIHINSIRLIDEDSIIISSRETSTIIKIDDIYEKPTIDYLIGSKQFWSDSGYDDLVLEQIGDFSLNAGQHCVEIWQDENLEPGQYYLYFYNNNNATITTYDYDYSQDPGYFKAYSGLDGEESYYTMYLVDETNRTFELVEEIPVAYSAYVSSVQKYKGNKIVDSGEPFTAVELDEQNNVIQSLVGSGSTWWYRVFKYDFNGYWFQ